MPTLTPHHMATLLVDRYNESVESAAEAVWDMEATQRVDVVLRNLYMISDSVSRSSAVDAEDIAQRSNLMPLVFSAYEAMLVSCIRTDSFDMIEDNCRAAIASSEEHTVALLLAFLRLASTSAS